MDRSAILRSRPQSRSRAARRLTQYDRFRARRWNARLRGLSLIGLGLIGSKVFAIVTLGAGTYASKIAFLAGGTAFDKAVAWLLWPDPVTLSLAHLAQSLGA